MGAEGIGAVERGREVVELARSRGFALAGVSGVERTRWAEQMRSWLESGKHGEMAYLEKNLAVRLDPAALLDGARSVLMVADVYVARGDGLAEREEFGFGKIARYARGRDYHKEMKKRLHAVADALGAKYPGEAFRSFVDTAPVLERELAARCGIGWVAKHTLVINEEIGSYMLLGGIVTTMEFAAPSEQAEAVDRCGTCTRCIDACPTGAIEPYSVDGSRCVSYLTIEMRGAYPEEHVEETGDWLVGCDICQEVCPHNSPRDRDGLSDGVDDRYKPRRNGFDLLEVLGWDEADRRKAFESSSLKRVKLGMMKRNALVVAGNQLIKEDLPGLCAAVERVACDESEPKIVRETARETLMRLGK